MDKKFDKRLKKHPYIVVSTMVSTMIFAVGIWNYHLAKMYDKTQELGEKETRMIIDSVRQATIIQQGLINIEKESKSNEFLNVEYRKGIMINEANRAKLILKLEQVNERIKLEKLLESLRNDFGLIEPGIQVINDPEYMKLYRQHETTLSHAVVLAKKMNVYDDYKELFDNRIGIWNMITSK